MIFFEKLIFLMNIFPKKIFFRLIFIFYDISIEIQLSYPLLNPFKLILTHFEPEIGDKMVFLEKLIFLMNLLLK